MQSHIAETPDSTTPPGRAQFAEEKQRSEVSQSIASSAHPSCD